MIKNYLKIAFRNLLRKKGFSIINISGLAVGMASAILILLWIQHEVTYDQFHEKKDLLYEAWNRSQFDGKLQSWNTTPKVLGKTIKADYPEVANTTRVNWGNSMLFQVGDKNLTVTGTFVDPAFLTMFSYPLVKGNQASALNQTYSIVVTEKLAEKLFGDEEPMGKVVRIENKDNFTITGVLKEFPDNTFLEKGIEYLLPWEYMKVLGWDDDNWGNNSTRTYVELKPNASIAQLEQKVKNITKEHTNNQEDIEVFLHPLSKWRLYSDFENGKISGGRIEIVRLFSIIAALILLIACINFMNLSTARSEKRAKEVGVRKVVGAEKKSLVMQFLGESVLLAFLAAVVAFILVLVSLNAFGTLVDKDLHISYTSWQFWITAVAFVIVTGIIAGSYPAFYLASFKAAGVLKGTFKAGNALITPRKVLVVLQFTFAIILIISTIVVQQQINHAQQRETGYAKNNLVYHHLTGEADKNYNLIRNELLSTGTAVAVSKTSAPITEGWSDSWGFQWVGKNPNAKIDINRFCADTDLAETVGLQILQGRDFDLQQFPTDSTACLINESAVEVMGFKSPIGQIIKDNGIDWHVVGVFKDFILQSPYQPIRPMVVEGAKGWFNVIHYKLNNQNSTSKNLQMAEQIFKKYNPQYPFENHFVDEEYGRKFEDEKRTATLAALFAGLTIFISCLGLFGLATYMAENRIKEIGVRKVLGASVTSITALLSKDFLKLVLISLVIAIPIGWWAMNAWLNNYEYRVDIRWEVFLAAGLLSMMIAILTVSYQSVKAGLSNPVKSLRSE